MTLSDRLAADALVAMLEKMRATGRMQGRIEVVIDAGQARALRIVRIAESEVVAVAR